MPNSGPNERISGQETRDQHTPTGEPWAKLVVGTATFSRTLANSLLEAHGLGHGPGQANDLCDPDLHAQAAEIHRRTLPSDYVDRTARSFADCSRLMRGLEAQTPKEPLPPGWNNFVDYLDAVAESLAGAHEHNRPHGRPGYHATDSVPVAAPAVIRYDLLAELMTVGVVRRLAEISTSVLDYATAAQHPFVTDEERDWLERLARGERVVEIAIDCGLSQRAMYRALQQLWLKLGASSRVDGIVIATRLGLVHPPETNP